MGQVKGYGISNYKTMLSHGTHCIINKGVRVGQNSMIASGSVVVKDIPANSLAGGNPCRVIRPLEKYEKDKEEISSEK